MTLLTNDKTHIGWREWVSLPTLGIAKIKAKIDTGARTSALHAFSLKPFNDGLQKKISFEIHPIQRNTELVITCIADVIDIRWVTDSGGHREQRYVIYAPLNIGGHLLPIEITLTERDPMLFRMLLGRTALRQGFVIDPARSYLTKKTGLL